jgi:hypothetical protein
VRRRNDAGYALRSGPDHAGAFREMSWLKAWVVKIARRRGLKKAIVGPGAPADRVSPAEKWAKVIKFAGIKAD